MLAWFRGDAYGEVRLTSCCSWQLGNSSLLIFTTRTHLSILMLILENAFVLIIWWKLNSLESVTDFYIWWMMARVPYFLMKLVSKFSEFVRFLPGSGFYNKVYLWSAVEDHWCTSCILLSQGPVALLPVVSIKCGQHSLHAVQQINRHVISTDAGWLPASKIIWSVEWLDLPVIDHCTASVSLICLTNLIPNLITLLTLGAEGQD